MATGYDPIRPVRSYLHVRNPHRSKRHLLPQRMSPEPTTGNALVAISTCSRMPPTVPVYQLISAHVPDDTADIRNIRAVLIDA